MEVVASNLILLGNMKGRFEYPELRRIASVEYRKHRPDICIVEKKASGQSLIQDMRKSGLPVLEYTPDKDKVSRVYSASPMFESRRVWLPKDRSWAIDLYEELIGFPYAQHDDQVDAFAYLGLMLDKLMEAPTKQEIEEDEYESEYAESDLADAGRNATTGY